MEAKSAKIIIEVAIHQQATHEGIAVTCYENDVPAFVETELERLYGNLFSSLPHFQALGGLPAHTSTYVVRKNGEEDRRQELSLRDRR